MGNPDLAVVDVGPERRRPWLGPQPRGMRRGPSRPTIAARFEEVVAERVGPMVVGVDEGPDEQASSRLGCPPRSAWARTGWSMRSRRRRMVRDEEAVLSHDQVLFVLYRGEDPSDTLRGWRGGSERVIVRRWCLPAADAAVRRPPRGDEVSRGSYGEEASAAGVLLAPDARCRRGSSWTKELVPRGASTTVGVTVDPPTYMRTLQRCE